MPRDRNGRFARGLSVVLCERDCLAAHVGRLSAEVARLKRREAAQRGARKRGKT